MDLQVSYYTFLSLFFVTAGSAVVASTFSVVSSEVERIAQERLVVSSSAKQNPPPSHTKGDNATDAEPKKEQEASTLNKV